MTKQEISFYDKSQTDALLNAKANVADLATVATTGDYDDLTDKPTLATVATTGDYDDLIDKPDLSLKLDKVTTSGTGRVYGVDSAGVQEMLTYEMNATQYTVAVRGASGVLSVGTPTADAHAATKKYVDDLLGGWSLVTSTDWSVYVDSNGALTKDILIMLQSASEKVTMQYPKGTIITGNTIEMALGYSVYSYTARLDTEIMTNVATATFVRNRIQNQADMGGYTRLYFCYGENTFVANKKTAENNNNGVSLYIRG